MIRSHFISSIATAAILGLATPVLAQTSAPKSPSAKPAVQPATNAQNTKPLCSSLGHPNAGKLADKSTGMSRESSNSPVHMDCTPDSQASPATSSPSTAGSTSSSTSPITGSSSDANSSVTGSTSTVNPSIDLRGRSSATIDNTPSTGDQSPSSSATKK